MWAVKEREEARMIPKPSARSTGWVELSAKMGRTAGLVGGGRRQRTGAHLGCLSLMSIGYLSEGVKYALRYMGRDWGNSNRYQQIDGV